MELGIKGKGLLNLDKGGWVGAYGLRGTAEEVRKTSMPEEQACGRCEPALKRF